MSFSPLGCSQALRLATRGLYPTSLLWHHAAYDFPQLSNSWCTNLSDQLRSCKNTCFSEGAKLGLADTIDKVRPMVDLGADADALCLYLNACSLAGITPPKKTIHYLTATGLYEGKSSRNVESVCSSAQLLYRRALSVALEEKKDVPIEELKPLVQQMLTSCFPLFHRTLHGLDTRVFTLLLDTLRLFELVPEAFPFKPSSPPTGENTEEEEEAARSSVPNLRSKAVTRGSIVFESMSFNQLAVLLGSVSTVAGLPESTDITATDNEQRLLENCAQHCLKQYDVATPTECAVCLFAFASTGVFFRETIEALLRRLYLGARDLLPYECTLVLLSLSQFPQINAPRLMEAVLKRLLYDPSPKKRSAISTTTGGRIVGKSLIDDLSTAEALDVLWATHTLGLLKPVLSLDPHSPKKVLSHGDVALLKEGLTERIVAATADEEALKEELLSNDQAKKMLRELKGLVHSSGLL